MRHGKRGHVAYRSLAVNLNLLATGVTFFARESAVS